MILPVHKIQDILSDMDWETVFANTGKSLIELWDEEYIPYLKEGGYDSSQSNAEEWADKHDRLSFAQFLAIHLQKLYLADKFGKDYKAKCMSAVEALLPKGYELPQQVAEAIKAQWDEERLFAEHELIHLNNIFYYKSESIPGVEDALADIHVQWNMVREALNRLKLRVKASELYKVPPVRKTGESLDEYKQRMNEYLNTLS